MSPNINVFGLWTKQLDFHFSFHFLPDVTPGKHNFFWNSFLPLASGILTELLINKKFYYINMFLLYGRGLLVKDLLDHTQVCGQDGAVSNLTGERVEII